MRAMFSTAQIAISLIETRPASSYIQLWQINISKKPIEWRSTLHYAPAIVAPAGTLTPSLGPSAMAWQDQHAPRQKATPAILAFVILNDFRASKQAMSSL